ncbi:MAG: N-sulfoglucosamine sulfohydrolase [Cellvibrionaceae bacterium]|jgi:N-sulfoglucosamine sulfohydrolase
MAYQNIVYIHSHDTGRYIQPYGHQVETPNLQKLAEDGVLFRQHFCINPTCSPSRASLLTGSYPHQNGMLGLVHRGFSLNDYQQHLIHTLKPHGFETLLSGVQHVAHAETKQKAADIIGYDRYLGDSPEIDAVQFLESKLDRPFFLAAGFFETHREFPAEDELLDDPRYCQPPAPLPDSPETRLDMARYKTAARILDQKMGLIFDALERTGLAENTLVICTTDHGLAFPRMKCNLTDAGTGIMLMMRGPNGFSGGRVVNAMTNHLDIFPTICDWLNIDQPDWLEGKSLLPLINGEVEELHGEIFFETNFHAAYEPQRGVRTQRWKYIRRFDGRNSAVLPNIDNGESKSFLLEHGLQEHLAEAEQLYDLIYDPHEAHNLALEKSHIGLLDQMRAKVRHWMVETADPLLDGPLVLPFSIQVNNPDDISPQDRTINWELTDEH